MTRLLRRTSPLALGLVAFLALATPCRAGWDDFEFGQRLIEKGYIEYARKVFERILADDKRPAAERDRAKYGMALLGKADVIAAARNPNTPWSDLTTKMGEALGSIEDFVGRNAQDVKADEGRFEAGSLRLWFVDWASGLAQDKAALAARGTDAEQVLAEAQRQIESAAKAYADLKTSAKKPSDKEIAEYQWVTASYFKALVYPKCSVQARSALDAAKKALEDYATTKDGYLTGVYALDYLGLTWQEIGDCVEDEKARWAAYREALNWFISAAGTDDQGDEYRKIITLGYLHLGRLANHVGGEKPPVVDSKARDLMKEARNQLKGMLQRAPRAAKMESGILALVELGLVEWKLENAGEAVQVLKRASDAAQAAGLDGVRNRANAVLAQVVGSGAATGAGASGDPSIPFKVAEDLYAKGKWAEAVQAYQQVLATALRNPTPEALKSWVYPSWSKIGGAYANMKLFLEAATAYDAIVDEVRAGRIVGAGQDDKTTKLALDAMNRVRALLKELSDRTGEAYWRTRFNAFTEDQIALTKGAGWGQEGRTGELSYRRARDLFDEGRRAKDENAPAERWRKAFQDARPFFMETSKSVKSENQDLAWVYLARIAYELGEWDAVERAADDAAAYWQTPEAKRRLEEDEKVRGARRSHEAALAFWKAAALAEEKKPLDALKILDGYVAAYGRAADEYYRGRALGLRVELLADLSRIEDAKSGLVELTREAPDYFAMGRILAKVGGFYQAQVTAIQKKIAEVDREWLGPPEDRQQGVKSRLLAAEKRETALVATLSDLNTTVARLKTEIESGKLQERELADRKKDLAAREEQQTKTRSELVKTREEIAALSKRREELAAQKAALQREQAPPLRESADLYRRLDEIVRDLDAKAPDKPRRRSDNVEVLAYRYYTLARLEPDVPTHAAAAKDLYEQWLAFPDVKALPDADDAKRRNYRYLGDLQVRLAQAAEAAGNVEAAQQAYAAAVRYLQPTIAKLGANAEMVVAHMAGSLAVLPFTDPVSGKKVRIPVRKVPDAAALRDYVRDLGGERLPKYANDKTQADYLRAVQAFQRTLAEMPEDAVKRIVASLKDAGFDAYFFAEHAYAETDFLLTLARAYARSGVAENEMRAVAAARGVLESPPQAEEDSPEWWEAKSILLDVLVSIAERGAESGGAASGEAKSRAKDADGLIDSTKRLFPRIGGSGRAEATAKEWKALQARLRAAQSRLGVPQNATNLDAMPKEEPATPAPTGPK